VTSARTAVPSTWPVSADSPEGISTASTGRRVALMASMTAAKVPSTGAFKPVPRSASTTTPARARRRCRASACAAVSTVVTAPRQRASISAASPRMSSRRPTSQTSAPRRARRRWRAITKPSPPLLPLPQHTTTGPPGFDHCARSTRAAPAPARSMSTAPGVWCSMVHRSSARISAAVTTITGWPPSSPA
jgi:hypothetical protein